MKEYEKGVWYCSFRLNCGYLFISPYVRLPDDDLIIPEWETFPDNWEDILEKISSEHYASTDDGTRHRYIENWFISHTPMRASWPKAARGMAIIRSGEAVVHIPPELKSPTKIKNLRNYCIIIT